MRLGVIDIGSNTVHLLVVDAHYGAHPLPAVSHKIELRLSEHLVDNTVDAAGIAALGAAVAAVTVIPDDSIVNVALQTLAVGLALPVAAASLAGAAILGQLTK